MTPTQRLKAMADDTDLSEEERAACREAVRVIEALPVTADGVPIVPGLHVFDAADPDFAATGGEAKATAVTMFNSILTPLNDSDGETSTRTLYSTIEAAAEARAVAAGKAGGCAK